MIFGGFAPPNVGNTELWNGTSWTASTAMSTGRSGLGSSSQGTQTAALGFGGANPGTTNVTEAWTGQALRTRTITVS